MRLSCKFRFHIGILNQHWLVEQGRRPMLVTPPLWCICRVLCWQWNGQPFPRTLANKITDADEICGASREEQNIKRMHGCISLILLSLDAPGMSSNHRVRRPGARRSEDVRRSFFANNSSASPAEDVLGLVPLTGGRRPILPSMHGRSFTASLTREALRAERRAAAKRAVQGALKIAFCSFLDQLPPSLPPRPSTDPTFRSFLTQTPTMLTKELLQLPDAPPLLAQRCKLWRELPKHHHLRFVTVCGLRVVCIPIISYLHYQNKPKNSQRTSTRTERECFTILVVCVNYSAVLLKCLGSSFDFISLVYS